MIPKYNEMYNEVLKVLNNHNEMRLKDIVSEVSDLLNLSIEDRNLMLDNNKSTIIYYRLGWTKTYLVKAGLLETIKRGVFKITPEGKSVLQSGIKITDEYLMKYDNFVEFFQRYKEMSERNSNKENITPLENIDMSLKMISSRLSDELLELILSKEPIFFEKLVLDLLEKMGYAFDTESIIRTRYGNDEGIDGIVKEDKFGFRNIYVQAKRWNNSVGRPEIQKFLGAVAGQGGTKGLFITTSTFSNEALEYAKKQLQVKLVLVDGKMLTNLMIQYNLGVSVVKTYEIKQIDVDYFNNDLV